MNVRALLEELEGLDINLRAVGEDLEYEGPEQAITPVLLEQLKAHKAHLIAVCGASEAVAEEYLQPAEKKRVHSTADSEAHKLLAAGWKPKVRCGKTIWENPETGFYCSQEMAVHFSSGG